MRAGRDESILDEVLSMSSFGNRRRKARRLRCPFCKENVPAPIRVMTVFTPAGCLGERCSCGAVYAVDETGRLGGQALLDAQALLCDGDLHRAMRLETGKHVDVRSRRCPTQTPQVGAGRLDRVSASARVWFVRLRG